MPKSLRQQFDDGSPLGALPGAAEHPLGCAVEKNDSLVFVDDDDGIRRGFDHAAQQDFAYRVHALPAAGRHGVRSDLLRTSFVTANHRGGLSLAARPPLIFIKSGRFDDSTPHVGLTGPISSAAPLCYNLQQLPPPALLP